MSRGDCGSCKKAWINSTATQIEGRTIAAPCENWREAKTCDYESTKTPAKKPDGIKDGGLKMKYIILHAEDGRPVGPGRRFVLNIDSKDEAYGSASRRALEAFAESIYPVNKQLAIELFNWIKSR
jgi:hypothetical protein